MTEKELINAGLKKQDLKHRQTSNLSHHKEMEEKRYKEIEKNNFDEWLKKRKNKQNENN